jgi:tRNA-specific 2-thiouridylase
MAGMSSAPHSKIIVALSGGVDSAVAALCLLRAGYDVQGLHMTNWEDDDGYCTAARDYQDARLVCEDLSIPLHHVNFAREYRDQVFANFLAEYRAGRTPNPDVVCNREIKFGVLLDYTRRLGGHFIATGHYAQVEHAASTKLLKGVDQNKDQSYFLHAVSQKALEQALFPIGAMHKDEVRRMANDAGLSVHDKPDSTGICFIGERPFREFLSRFLPEDPGNAEMPDGTVVGMHCGLMYYTLGQRQGLGIGGRVGGSTEPWFVAGKDNPRNVLTVVQGRDHPLLWSAGLVAADLHWISGEPEALQDSGELRCAVKTRYRQDDVACRVNKSDHGRLQVRFDTPQWAVTPGQYAVFYAAGECLGGGPIAATIRNSVAHPEPSTA